MASVLNTVYGWTRSHSLTLLLPSPHISMRGVIILQLAGQQYIVPLSEMGWGGCFALTPHWRLNWHSAATQCSATHKHTGCNQQSSAWFCVFNPQSERLLQKDFKPPSHAEVTVGMSTAHCGFRQLMLLPDNLHICNCVFVIDLSLSFIKQWYEQKSGRTYAMPSANNKIQLYKRRTK